MLNRKRIPEGKGVLSPADGRIMDVNKNSLSIFMGPFDSHVNLAPMDGIVEEIIYKKGGFSFAFMKKSEKNERNIIRISTEYGEMMVIQIAGFFLRRIVCYVRKGDEIKRGQEIGIIRFGSRVDLVLPEPFKIVVSPGKKVRAGESVVAIWQK
ncbi:MAG: phosphatidylserine decarboxylase [Candidatus Syntropharchaeia archaeon]